MISTAALAADLPVISPPLKAPPVIEDVGSGWYLRGDIGFSNQQIKSLTNPGDNAPGILSVTNVGDGFNSAPLGDVGIGYQFNNWLRLDATAQYRGAAAFHGADNTVFNNGGVPGYGSDNYTASKSEWLFLANAYVDLGTWWCVTPFIGAGAGMAKVNITGFRDDGVAYLFPAGSGVGPATAYFGDQSSWNFAWAFHAGLSYKVTPNVSLEVAYHYVNMGNGLTGLPRQFDNSPVGTVGAFTFNNITSQDFTIGMRWLFDTPAPAVPLMRRG
jgi:opacity protein-like surface antigen